MKRMMNRQPGRSKENPAHVPANTRQRGLTLIELMIALTLGMLLLGIIIAILMGSRQTYRVNEATSRMQDNARYAFQVLSRDIRGAGYFGCIGSDVTPTNTLNSPTDFLYNFVIPIQGYEATSTSAWTPAPDGSITSPLGGADIIVIRGVEGSGAKVVSHASGVADLNVAKPSGLAAGDVVLVSDCLAAAIFQITGIGGGLFDSVGHAAGAGAPGNATNDLGKDYTGGEILKIATRVYYVRTNADGRPALYRKAGAAAAEEVVEGVENMQIQYGVDTNGDLTADEYRKADAVTVADWPKVVSARVSLLMQTIDNNVASQAQPYTYNGATTTPTDRRLRQVYSTVIALRNRAP
jgi:type IV pilus assembly protein PilW